MAITVHYIDYATFENKAYTLDLIYLTEVEHSGEYMCKELLKVTDFYGISMSIFTVTRDNASLNNTLLTELEASINSRYYELEGIDHARFFLRFKVFSGDIRCFTHIINLGVQQGKFKILELSFTY